MTTKPIHMRFSDETVQQIDDLRRVEPDIPNRSEMVRRLIQRAQKTAEALKVHQD